MKLILKYLIVFLTLLPSKPLKAQVHQERTVLLYNVTLGAVTAGIGGVINKPKGMKWHNAFLRAASQGSLGGLLNYSGKKTLYLMNSTQNSWFGIPARILHAAGNSITENAALHEPFLQNWNIAYGPVRLDLSFKKKTKVRFLPEALYAAIITRRFANKFDVKQSLATGVLVFSNKDVLQLPGNNQRLGVSYGRAIAYVDNYPNYVNKGQLLAHEVMHNFQYEDFQLLNTWFRPLEKKIRSKTIRDIFTKYVYADLPWFYGIYVAEGYHQNPHYFRNFYEYEAERFSTNSFVPQ